MTVSEHPGPDDVDVAASSVHTEKNKSLMSNTRWLFVLCASACVVVALLFVLSYAMASMQSVWVYDPHEMDCVNREQTRTASGEGRFDSRAACLAHTWQHDSKTNRCVWGATTKMSDLFSSWMACHHPPEHVAAAFFLPDSGTKENPTSGRCLRALPGHLDDHARAGVVTFWSMRDCVSGWNTRANGKESDDGGGGGAEACVPATEDTEEGEELFRSSTCKI